PRNDARCCHFHSVLSNPSSSYVKGRRSGRWRRRRKGTEELEVFQALLPDVDRLAAEEDTWLVDFVLGELTGAVAELDDGVGALEIEADRPGRPVLQNVACDLEAEALDDGARAHGRIEAVRQEADVVEAVHPARSGADAD